MLTKIEIDGFKSFEDFSLELGPFTVLLGQNAAGKSNLFDALRFLSGTATMDLRGAAQAVRGEALRVFREDADGRPADTFRLAAEVLLPNTGVDPFGQAFTLLQTRLRYELEVGLRTTEHGLPRLVVLREEALPIRKNEDPWAGGAGRSVARAALSYRRGQYKPFLTTDVGDAGIRFELHQDGRTGRHRPAPAAESTALREITTAEDFRHLHALRRELASWQFLQLDPAALRLPSSALASDLLATDGANLATVLWRIRSETAEPDNPDGALVEIAADLAALIPGFRGLEVDEDRRARQYQVRISMEHEPVLPSQVASDGTLRLLALLALIHDPRQTGMICFEEPENGLHPSRVKALLARLRQMTTAAGDDPPAPGLQFVLNSHSPVVLAALDLERDEGAMIDAMLVSRPGADTATRRSRVRPIRQRLALGQHDYVGPGEVDLFLSYARPEPPEEAEE